MGSGTFRTICAVGGLVAASPAVADSFTDFEAAGFVPGQSVDNTAPDGSNQPISNVNACVQAWFIPTPAENANVDEEIVDISGDDAVHGKVWRLSPAADGNLSQGQAPQSARKELNSGEEGAVSDAGCGAQDTNAYYAEVEFRSATGAAQGSPATPMSINLVANAFDTRQAFVRIIDDGGGFDLLYFAADATCATFPTVSVDSNLTYDEFHRLGIEIFFVDGPLNDVVNLYLDGQQVVTSTSWEGCFSPQRSVDRLSFEIRNSDGSQGEFQGGGFYFDNVLVTEACPPGNCVDAAQVEHFACYDVREIDRFDDQDVTLEDQFRAFEEVRVRRAVSICAPVDKNGEGVSDTDTHLVCYDIAPRKRGDAQVVVDNQFGEQAVEVQVRKTLCVPSGKSGLAD